MVRCLDFVHWLEEDMSFKILTSLDKPSDLVRVSCVSGSWHQFVITNSLCKELCLRMFPQLSGVDHVSEPSNYTKRVSKVGHCTSLESETLEREHRVYAFLAHCCTSVGVRECITEAISASSTDNYPEEGIHNTLEVRDRVGRMASYWSSKGHKNPAAPETLIYRLAGDLCVVTEIGVQPFQAYFQPGYPIYSAQSVRFHMGHSKVSNDTDSDIIDQSHHDSAYEKFVWTYTSPVYTMKQENCLQMFKLPEPVLCIGGVLLVELLGRVQRQEMDGLFYICVSHVQVQGRPLSPAFGVEVREPPGKFVLKVQNYSLQCIPEITPSPASSVTQILNLLRGDGIDPEYAWDEEQDESDEEIV